MSEEMIQQIATVDGIAGYGATLITLPRIFNDNGEELAHENYSFYNYGSKVSSSKTSNSMGTL